MTLAAHTPGQRKNYKVNCSKQARKKFLEFRERIFYLVKSRLFARFGSQNDTNSQTYTGVRFTTEWRKAIPHALATTAADFSCP